MKTAIIHDYLNQYGGAERVLETLLEIYPDADVFTLLYDKNSMPDTINKANIKKSFLSKFPFSKFYYEYLLPFYPIAVESFDTRKYDLVISNSSAWSKGVITNVNTCHIVYCLNPMRFVWDSYFSVIKKNAVVSRVLRIILHHIRLWDEVSAKRGYKYIAISENVSHRIKKHYEINAEIINPPVDTDFFAPAPLKRQEEYYLIVSRLKAYKRIELAIETFNDLKKPLLIIGDGSHYNHLKSIAGKNIQFLRELSDEKLLSYYQRCKAVIFPQIEDFGIVPLEAQACGKPVIAFKSGGALETIEDKKTGIFFGEQTKESLKAAVAEFEKTAFNSDEIRAHSLSFSKSVFKKRFKERIADIYDEYRMEMKL
ncbi:MAG: glycosyltransferase [bacterium]